MEIQEVKAMLKEVLNGDIGEIKSALTDLLSSHNVMLTKIGNIEIQTEKTNGRVTKSEDKIHELAVADQKHFSSCPIAPKIEQVQRDIAEARKEVAQVVSNKSFIAKVVTIAISIIGAIGVLIGILINFLLKK